MSTRRTYALLAAWLVLSLASLALAAWMWRSTGGHPSELAMPAFVFLSLVACSPALMILGGLWYVFLEKWLARREARSTARRPSAPHESQT